MGDGWGREMEGVNPWQAVRGWLCDGRQAQEKLTTKEDAPGRRMATAKATKEW